MSSRKSLTQNVISLSIKKYDLNKVDEHDQKNVLIYGGKL